MVSTETSKSLGKRAALNNSDRKSTAASGVRVEEMVRLCITRDASFPGEPPQHGSVV